MPEVRIEESMVGRSLTDEGVTREPSAASFEGILTASLYVGAMRNTSVQAPSRIVFVQGAPGPGWVWTVIPRLSYLASLEKDWDSEEAQPVSPAAINVVVDVLMRLMERETIAPDILPDRDGGLSVEWHANDVHLEFGVDSAGETEVWFEDPTTGDSWEGELQDNLTRLLPAMRRLIARKSD